MEKDEKKVYFIVRVIIGIIMAVFFIAGYIVPPNFVTETLWEKLHPTSFLNLIGVILFVITGLALAGIPQRLIEKLVASPGSQWPNYLFFATGALGIILIWV